MTNKKLVSSVILQSVDSLVREILQERGLGFSKRQLLLHECECLGSFLNVLLSHTTCTLVEHLGRIGCCISINNVNFGQGGCLKVLCFLGDFLHLSHSIIRRFLLVCNFSGNNSSLVHIWQIDFDEHKSTHVSMSLVEVVHKGRKHFVANGCPVFPVAWSLIITSDMKNTVSGNPGENLLVIILEQSIH